MAYAAAASLSHTIDIFLTHHQHSISPQFKPLIISLHEHAIFLQSFLENTPRRANNWEETIREAAYDAEDTIELLLSDSWLESTVGSLKSKIHHNLNELRRVAEVIESITSRIKGRRVETSGGSDLELQEIISRLRGGSSALEKIAIVGIGGMGKTTLARKAYDNPLITEHFDIRAWSTASTDYTVRGVVLDLLQSMSKSIDVSIFPDSEDELISYVFKMLENVRYLIVLDDIWSLGYLNRMVKFMLPDNGNGSRIMLTSRLYSVALTAAYTHRMRFLNVDEGWDLLREKIFDGDPCPFQLEHFGKMIAIRCRGHPLSIEVVSGILAADQTEAAWEDVSEKMKIASEHCDDGFLRILYLSYVYLPHHLRPCFLYLACFPKDHKIHVSKLVKLWVAEGFLRQNECKSFEVVGEECVEALVRRSLVSVSKRKSDGSIKSIKVHDLLRDLCLAQAHRDSFIFDGYGIRRLDQDQHATAMELQACRRVSRVIYGNDILEGVCGTTIRTIILHLNSGGLGVRCSIGNVRLLRICRMLTTMICLRKYLSYSI